MDGAFLIRNSWVENGIRLHFCLWRNLSLLFLKPDGQGIHAQNVLILNVLRQGEYHADTDVLCAIFGIHDFSGHGRCPDPGRRVLVFGD